MIPLNRAERNNAFLGFLLLFLITIGIVIMVFFFSIEVPFTENNRLRSRVAVMQREQNLSDTFRVIMDVVQNELAFDLKKDNVELTHRNVELTHSSVQLKLLKMGEIIKKMSDEKSTEEKSIYEMVIQNLADLNDAKLEISNLKKRN